ncbi:hypothetical protein P7K49_004481, partial [Saguinus oedipus]
MPTLTAKERQECAEELGYRDELPLATRLAPLVIALQALSFLLHLVMLVMLVGGNSPGWQDG